MVSVDFFELAVPQRPAGKPLEALVEQVISPGLTFSRRALPRGGGRGVACACGVRDDRASSSGEGPATCAGAAAAVHTVRAPGCDFTARATK